MIKETELIYLNGNPTAFGGRIYNADYQIGFNQSPSSVRLSIINEEGSYNIDENDLTVLGSPDEISFGDRALKMFPIEYSIDRGDGGKILTVEYNDPSIVYLDKKFVVLNGTHVSSKTNSPSSAIMTVGQKYYSEEKDAGDGIYVQNLVTTPPNEIDLGQSLYYVSELYEVMQQHGIPMHSSVANVLLNKDGSSSYLNNIVGSLRSVLMAWGDIMAFAFYWGEDNKLHFIDLAADIDVNFDKLENIVPFSDQESYSLKDTVDRGYSLYYGKAGSITRSSGIGTGKTSFYFKRGIENLNNQNQTGLAGITNPLNLIKAASLGEDFFIGYILYLSFPSGGDSQSIKDQFGIQSVELFEEDSDSWDYLEEEREMETDFQEDYALVGFEIDDPNYTWGFFNDIIGKILTFELPIKESEFEKFNSWDRSFSYDRENSTNYINPNTSNSNDEYRAYFEAPFAEFFIITPTENTQPANFVIPIDFTDKTTAESRGFNQDKQYVLVKKQVDWNSAINNITFKENKTKYHVRGFNISGGAFNNVVPKKESIFTDIPTFNSNVISVDMQLDTTSDNEVILAGQSFDNIASILNESYTRDKKTFRKNFSVTGITLPQKIEPEDGLQSISISNTSDRGTVSTYTVGNGFFKIPSKDVLLQKLEREKFASLPRNGGGFNISFRYF